MTTSYDIRAAHWRKSSYSGGNAGDCLEVAERFPGAACWRKSSYSGASAGECLEVADGLTGIVPVRDSKDLVRPALVFRAGEWASFVTAVKKGQFGAG